MSDSSYDRLLNKAKEEATNLLEVVAMGLCAKNAIPNGGNGHGNWWELSEETKMVEEELNPGLETVHDGFYDVWYNWDQDHDT